MFLGGLIGWLWSTRRPNVPPPDERLETELRQQLMQREGELASLRLQLSDHSTRAATAEANRDAAQKLLAEQRVIYEESGRQAQQTQAQALENLREAFKALSADALKQTQPEFLRLANETLSKFQESAKGDLAHRQQTIATLVKPLEEQLKIYQHRLAQSETNQSTAIGELRKHLETLAQQSQCLSTETLQLRRVLSSNQARGRWGEQTLRRVVEASGMSSHCDFCEQIQAGDSKPDLIIRLPGERIIIVDAKVPDLDFLHDLELTDEAARARAVGAHAAKLRNTVKELADRDYPAQFPNALDYVVLFLPAESLFSAALEGDQDLILWAQHRRIILATPTSLIAILRSVCFSWQQNDQNENARAIAETAQELYQRVSKFTEHFENIRAGLERANQSFNEAVGSYERMVKPSGERLIKLGGSSNGKLLADVPPLITTLRPPPQSNPLIE